MPEPDAQPTAPRREPAALSSEYHKARKQLMLWAAILSIWELVGIDLDKAKEAGGNAGAVIGAIKSPQAIPWALLILVAYFVFKVTVEWFQCSPARRGLRVSRIDFVSAWLVSFSAVALYIGQAISRTQFADLLTDRSKRYSLLLSVLASISLGVGWFQDEWRRTLLIMSAGLVPIAVWGFFGGINWTMVLVGAASATLLMGASLLSLQYLAGKTLGGR